MAGISLPLPLVTTIQICRGTNFTSGGHKNVPANATWVTSGGQQYVPPTRFFGSAANLSKNTSDGYQYVPATDNSISSGGRCFVSPTSIFFCPTANFFLSVTGVYFMSATHVFSVIFYIARLLVFRFSPTSQFSFYTKVTSLKVSCKSLAFSNVN